MNLIKKLMYAIEIRSKKPLRKRVKPFSGGDISRDVVCASELQG